MRLILASEVNIPELTSRLQEIVKSKVQDTLGIEDQIIVRIHVAKIIAAEDRERRKKESEKEEQHPIPFGGYGRT